MNIKIANSNSVCIIDDASYSLLLRHNEKMLMSFNSNNNVQMHSTITKNCQLVSRMIMEQEPFSGWEVDHINCNKLDNRLANLRLVDKASNLRNRDKFLGTVSKFKCVTWNKKAKKWYAKITFNGKSIHGGTFDDEESAAVGADNLMLNHGYDLRNLNFPIVYGA